MGCPQEASPNALVVSLNFTPGHFSHLAANYRMLEESGYLPCLYVHPKFDAMDADGRLRKCFSTEQVGGVSDVALAVFWFPSLANIPAMARLRRRGAKLTYVLHEPFDSISSYYRAGFGVAKIVKICLISLASALMVRLANEVILPSELSAALYLQRYRWLNPRFHCIPLIFDDELPGGDLQVVSKDCVSYIGTVAADHAFDCFVDFVAASVRNGLLPGMRFVIATRSEIPERERQILAGLAHCGRVQVQSGRPLSNEEINAHFLRSAVVWNAYRRSNQSGVLPKAFMFGSAVLVSRRLANEFVDDRVTGRLIGDNSNVEEISAAIAEIGANVEAYAAAARSKFLDTFFYRSKMKEMIDVIAPRATRSLDP